MEYEYKVTIFTPTYNRAYILNNLYRSICIQTCHDFEWIIVDDGSTDNTRELVEKWILDSNDISISYYYQINGGKHRATNFAVTKAKGELFFIVDSDDYLTEEAIEKIIKYRQQIDNIDKYAGIFLNRGKINSCVESTYQIYDATYYEKNRHFCTSGEKADVLFTSVLKRYPYPVFEGENFMTEGVIYNRMAEDGLLIRWIDDIIYLFDYLEGGLTDNSRKLFLNNPKGYFLFLKEWHPKTSIKSKITFYYMFFCDIKEQYTIGQINKITGINMILLWCFHIFHLLKH